MSVQRIDPTLNIEVCTWEHLLVYIDSAVALDENKGKKNKLRGALRNAKADVQLLNSLASIIPDEKGLSFLRGGLSVIFQVCHDDSRHSCHHIHLPPVMDPTNREQRERDKSFDRYCGAFCLRSSTE